MSQLGSGFCEWHENLLAALRLLRVFRLQFLDFDIHYENALPFITKSSNRAHKLEYFVIFDFRS
jgi:acetoin utilization deacetylase AcuC-like enzyme